MAARMAQLSLFAVALIIGILLVGQLRSQARPIELSSLSAQELSTLIERQSARNVELSDGLANLREQIRDYERAELQGRSVLELTQENVDGLATFAGLRGVEGQGIVIEIDGSFDPTAVNDLIFELRNAGAEAIAVDDVRITAGSVAVLGTGAIEIDGVALGRAITISAIGSPPGLRSAIERPGGILTLLQQSIDAVFTVEERTSLVVPATRRDLTPQVARSVE
ncbi:MAG TPA: DUF881 domain-containing protein [Candidatus Limnocylindrales bacterium]|nr:DUF881 domain-containing protein [Candidatus Limnocylindrales bacterium]